MRERIKPDNMDQQQQRDAIVGMQRDMHHVLEALQQIRATMATQKDLELLATKAEVSALSSRLEVHERETTREIKSLKEKVAESSIGSLWRTATGIAVGFTSIVAAVVIVIKWASGTL